MIKKFWENDNTEITNVINDISHDHEDKEFNRMQTEMMNADLRGLAKKLTNKFDSHFEFDLERSKWKDLIKKKIKFSLRDYRALINYFRVNYRCIVLLHWRMALSCAKGISP